MSTVRVLSVCGCGQGSSMIMKLKIGQFLTSQKVDHKMHSCAVSEAKAEFASYDIVVAAEQLAANIAAPQGKYVIGVRNMLSAADFGPKLMEVINAHFPGALKA
ncbi:PTS system ascorbate-specific IIB component [Silvimonas terrae]|uniref:PTS system ascorbate-specific IIB component n=1 Tax=Silvimonas terrae TaxID=300266 RepID=A0A840RIJ4_9NEIS|nr:PTS ascorbate transporter subunit IIB [Silvimonas terrae]MBB5192001.1 PTS system ascorbate-specific IIB component [Silvimonas terrae]